MTANFRKPGLLYPCQATHALPSPAPFVTRFRPASRHIPAKNSIRESRRTARAAEQAAWDAVMPEVEPVIKDTPRERRAFLLLGGLAAMGIVWSLVQISPVTDHLLELVATVRQLIG